MQNALKRKDLSGGTGFSLCGFGLFTTKTKCTQAEACATGKRLTKTGMPGRGRLLSGIESSATMNSKPAPEITPTENQRHPRAMELFLPRQYQN
jgi:hypothetical protein